MWNCPKCNREFKNMGQSHYCGKPKTIDEYIASQEADVQVVLEELRETIKRAASDAGETIKWGMPYFIVDGENLCGFAAQKKHISFFPGESTVVEFEARLDGYKAAKGTVQLPYDKPLDGQLIADMVEWRWHNR